MDEKVVLITGSTSGIGRATALNFARLGCKLVIHGTNLDRGVRVVAECKATSPRNYEPLLVIGDIRNLDTCKELICKTITCYQKLDVLVNNAGLFKAFTIEDPNALPKYLELMRINLDSVVYLSNLAVDHLRKSNGCIVNVSSNLAFQCMRGAFAYSAAKAGLSMLTKCLAVDLAPKVRVNSVSPGPVATQMSTRSGVSEECYRSTVGSSCLTNRVGEANEIARVIVFLASPESSYITGSDMVIDGGSSIKPVGMLASSSSESDTPISKT